MSKKTLTTTERFLKSLTPKQRKQYAKERKEFLISEMILAVKAGDNTAAKTLAKMADIPPQLKSFDEYLATRLNTEEIAEIKQQAKLEIKKLKHKERILQKKKP